MRMRVRVPAFLLALALALLAFKSVASDYYLDITNRTGYIIYYAYVSPAQSGSWEDDVLGDSVLNHDETYRVFLNGYTNPIFDVQLVDEEGDSYTFWNVDVSREDIVVTLDHLD